MEPSLLDTDILAEIFKLRNQSVAAKAAAYLQQHGQFDISAITRFEVVRGLRHKRAAKSLTRFESMCARMLVVGQFELIFSRNIGVSIRSTISSIFHVRLTSPAATAGVVPRVW